MNLDFDLIFWSVLGALALIALYACVWWHNTPSNPYKEGYDDAMDELLGATPETLPRVIEALEACSSCSYNGQEPWEDLYDQGTRQALADWKGEK